MIYVGSEDPNGKGLFLSISLFLVAVWPFAEREATVKGDKSCVRRDASARTARMLSRVFAKRSKDHRQRGNMVEVALTSAERYLSSSE